MYDNPDDDVIKGTGPEMTKYPRKRNKKLVASLNPIENFKAYPGRPGYSGSLSSVFENQVKRNPTPKALLKFFLNQLMVKIQHENQSDTFVANYLMSLLMIALKTT